MTQEEAVGSSLIETHHTPNGRGVVNRSSQITGDKTLSVLLIQGVAW